jgi:alcohol dehydrogenase
MQALVFKKGILSLQEIDKPVPKKGEAFLRVKKAGICGTDLSIISRDYEAKTPLVLGHEIFAVIEGLHTPASKFSIGDRVTTEINVSCGSCGLCKSGLRTHCANIETIGISRHGGFAEYLTTPIENLHLIPDSIGDEEGVFVEPLAAAIELTNMTTIPERSTIAVIGIGRLGLLILQVLKLHNPKILVGVTRHNGNTRKNQLARTFGADEILLGDQMNDSVSKLTNGLGFDHVIEATGTTSGVDLALEITKPRGTIHVKSTHGLPINLNITKLILKEIRIQGSRCGPFGEAIQLIEEGKVRTKEMITNRFSLHNFETAFEAARSPNEMKVIFEPH